MSENLVVMGYLWHSMEPHSATTVEFCNSSKKIWYSTAEYCSHQSNVPRVYEIYEKILSTKQSGKSLFEYYSSLKNLWNQLLQYWPNTIDLAQQKQHWVEFMIATLLSSLDSNLGGFKDQILTNETLPSIVNISRLLCSSLGQNSIDTTLDSSALISSNGGCGGFCGGRGGHSSRAVSHGYGRNGGHGDEWDHCGGINHIKPYCWEKYGKPDYLHYAIDGTTQSQSTFVPAGHTTPSSESHDALTSQLK